MNDFYVSISQLQPHSNDVEKYRHWEKVRLQATLRFEANATGTTDGAGTWLTLWQGIVPTDTRWNILVNFVGSSTSGSVVYDLSVGIDNIAGVAAPIAVSSQITFSREDFVGANYQFDLTGTLFSVQVQDDSLAPMTWKVFIQALGTV